MAVRTIVYVLHALMHVYSQQSSRQMRRYAYRRGVTSRGCFYISRVLQEDPTHFRQEYRMFPDVFRKLSAIIRERGLLSDTRHVTVEDILATFMLVVGQNNRYPALRRIFSRSHFTTGQNFHRMLTAMNILAVDLMAKPSTGVQSKIRDNTKFYPFYKDCIGSIDGTHIPATVWGRETASFRNRHGDISQSVLAVCNSDLEFINVLAGWEGSAHDSNFFACGYDKGESVHRPRGTLGRLVGIWRMRARELFNLRHALLRNKVERIFGIFKSPFTLFKRPLPFPFDTQVEMLLACVGLHNFLRKERRSDEFPPDDELLPPIENMESDVIHQTRATMGGSG